MKKFLSVLLLLSLLISLCACGSESVSTLAESVAAQPSKVETEATAEPIVPAEAKAYEISDCRAKAYTDSIGTQWVQTIIEISNTGSSNLYLGSANYDLEDANGKLIASKSFVSAYPSVIAPGEKGYIYDETTLEEAVEGELTVLPRENVEKAKVDLIRFPVTDAELSDSPYGGVKILGRVENTSAEAQSFVYIAAFLYDADGKCIGQVFTILSDELAPGAKVGFEMSGFSLPDDVTADTVADFVIYAYPTQIQF